MLEEELIPTQGELIRAERIKKGLTQKQLAEKMGVSETYISQYERNLRRPKPNTIRRIAAALEIDPFSVADFENTTEMLFTDMDSDVLRYGENFPALMSAFCELTDEGQKEAVKRVQELAALPQYRLEKNYE